MYRWKVVGILAIILGVCGVAKAGEHPIDKKLGKCNAKNYTTDGMNNCMNQAYEEWDAELNKNYKLLMGILSGEEKQQLKESQLAWIKYRDLDTTFRMDAFLNMQGTMYTNMAMIEKLDIVSDRSKTLGQLYEILKDVRG